MIIGLVGYKGSGKTTACNIIKKHLPDVVQINFKDALVEELKENFQPFLSVLNARYNCNWDWLFENKPPEIRTIMQCYGTNVRRAEDTDYWVDQWKENLPGYRMKQVWTVKISEEPRILTDDVRFHNEAKAIKDAGGILIRLERTDLEQTDTHQSETEQKEIECDYTIACGGGELDKLEEELLKIIK